MKKFLQLIIFISTIHIIITSCGSDYSSEIPPGRKPLVTKSTPLIPLPTTQRFGLLPIEQRESTSMPALPLQNQQTSGSFESLANSEKTEENKTAGSFMDFQLEWTTPTGWVETPKKPMRVVTFNGGENSHWECYITVISSQAGGIKANISRWAKQMGKEQVEEIDISKLPEINILGKKCPLLEITGTYTDMQNTEYPSYKLLGTICSFENLTIFVKMIGPEAEINQEKDKFIELCNSLKFKD